MLKDIWPKLEEYWNMFRAAALDRNTADQYIAAAATLVAVFLVLWIVKGLITRRFTKWGERADNHVLKTVGEMGRGTRLWFLLIIAIFCSSYLLDVPAQARLVLNSVTIAVLLLQAGFWGNKLMHFGVERFVRKTADDEGAGKMTAAAITLIGSIALWSIVLLAMLANFGIDVTAMVAGLGVGGIAIALAAQNILGDLFASLSIVLDKPFVLGDFVIVGDYVGNIERVGLKTTRVRSLTGEQIIFSNTDLLQSRIRNYKRMQERRIVFSIGITYETPAEQIKALPGMLKEIVTGQDGVRFDRAHFHKYGDFALLYEIVYYVLVPDYAVYMDVQQQINFEILDRLQSAEIEFAYPTQTLILRREGAS
jgi:small-conductance mechanosensitive channel